MRDIQIFKKGWGVAKGSEGVPSHEGIPVYRFLMEQGYDGGDGGHPQGEGGQSGLKGHLHLGH